MRRTLLVGCVGSLLLLTAGVGSSLGGCATMNLRSAVDMTVTLGPETPRGALVYIDERYIGTVAAVAARGVRIPQGKHRLTIEKTGYFPVDRIIVSRLQPIELHIEMLKLPE